MTELTTKRGRPVTTGSGRRVSFYAPVKLLQLIGRICKEWNIQNQSEFIQEAIVRYAAELDAINQEGEQYGKARINP